MTIGCILKSRAATLLGAALLLGGAWTGAAEAMPMAAGAVAPPRAVEQAAFLHRHYPGYHSRSARAFRHMRRNTPNRFCQNQPSRCR